MSAANKASSSAGIWAPSSASTARSLSTRVSASLPAFWREICLENREALGDALGLCLGELEAMRKALDRGDAEALDALLRKGYRGTDL